jgi:bifunctional enzyme CysN/CysC/sulfate adenylyltransferase subunit 1
LAERLRDALEARGHRAVLIDDSLIPDASLTAVVRALDIAGVTAITSRQLAADVLADVVRATQGFAEGEVVVGDGLEEDEILRLAGVRI